MIDNFKQIKELLQFDSEDDFYHAVVLQRKKENDHVGSNSHVVKTYYIRSLDDLDYYQPEMINLANFHNARVCINLNRRSFEKVAFQTLRKITDIIMNKDYKSVRKAYNSVCGGHSNEKEKRWIIDVDEKNLEKIDTMLQYLQDVEPVGNKEIAIIETKNGYHVITKPFNLQQAGGIVYGLDIQKDNPSILYIP